jgi:type IV pilus assembly protein PilA
LKKNKLYGTHTISISISVKESKLLAVQVYARIAPEISTQLEGLMDSTTIIRIVAGLFFVGVFVGILVLFILYLLTLYRALTKCSISSRTMQPGMVFLLFIPLVNLVWQFFVVIGIADSLDNEFRARRIPNVEPKPGKSIGIAMCICGVCAIIPILGVLAFLVHLVLWIIYWTKIAEFSRRLDQAPAADGAALYAPQNLQPGMPLSPPGTIPPPPPLFAPRSVPVFVWVLVALGVGFVLIVLILALIAIPSIGSMKKKANEASAINSVKTITTAETQYEFTYPSNGYACSLSALGGDPNSGPPSATSAQMLQNDLASGHKSGYIFTVGNCTKETVNSTDSITSYQITAVPQKVGKTGNRGFCADQSGVIMFDPEGGSNCTQTLGQ